MGPARFHCATLLVACAGRIFLYSQRVDGLLHCCYHNIIMCITRLMQSSLGPRRWPNEWKRRMYDKVFGMFFFISSSHSDIFL